MKNQLHENTIKSLAEYIKLNPDEKIEDLLLKIKADESLITRSNLSGHVTASGLVLHNNTLLLIFHKKLQKYLQPGGHLENDEKLVEAAKREVFEETGIETVPFETKNDVVVPLHVDIHTIPHNENKNEPEHYHYDCMFLLKAKDSEIHLQESEVEDFKWLSLDYEFTDEGIIQAVKKIKGVLHL